MFKVRLICEVDGCMSLMYQLVGGVDPTCHPNRVYEINMKC